MSSDEIIPPGAGTSEARPKVQAPLSWHNWHAMQSGLPLRGIYECSLFSDAWFIAEASGKGPYDILNALPSTSHAGGMYEWKPALVLRFSIFVPSELPDMSRTADDHYHGGWLPDEIAALIALILGARISAGPVEREFDGRDPLGRPRAHSASRLPILPPSMAAPQIPSLFGQRDLREFDLIDTFPGLTPDAAIALVKSARLYQQALWVSDMSPETSWLLFVSAIECAAGFWAMVDTTPAERLKRSYPELERILQEDSGPELVDKVAQQLQRLIGAQAKFRGFCKRFAPDPPDVRPESGLFDFKRSNFTDAIELIYGYRSRALHGGTPFPKPMCDPPSSYDEAKIVEERPSSISTSTLGASWLASDLPMHLHLFAHITRSVLLNWWRSLTESSPDAASQV